jgi:trehalose 6-phosphate synthase/phosphatase
MFKALENRAYTIKIGNGSTAAKYNISSQGEVLGFMKKLVANTMPETAAVKN